MDKEQKTNETNKMIANNIKTLRQDLGLTQKEFGHKLNITDTMISKYEKGNRRIGERTISQICNTFNVRENFIYEGTGDMYNSIEEIDISGMMGKVFADDDDFLKKVFITFSKLNDNERAFLKKLISELNSK